MGYDFHNETLGVARKNYKCEHCAKLIAAGASHTKVAGKFDGEFYSVRVHSDCHQLWGKVFENWGDPYDGMPYRFSDVFVESGDPIGSQAELDEWRGLFPHAVCRVEFHLRKFLEDQPHD